MRRGEMGMELGLGGGEGCKWRELVKVLDNSCSLSDIILLSLYILSLGIDIVIYGSKF